MINSGKQPGEKHPPLNVLLLHVDGELTGTEASSVESHVNRCWECRTRCERLRQGIYQYMEFHAHEEFPAPPPERFDFHRRLRAAASEELPEPRQSLFRRAIDSVSARWRIAIGLAATAALLLWLVANPSNKLNAAVILNRAIASSLEAQPAGRVVYQRILVTQGSRKFERAYYRGVKGNTEPGVADASLQRSFAAGGVDWNDPLNPQDFSSWRSAQREIHDEIREDQQTLTIATSVTNDGPVRQSSLTVRNSDYRAVGRRVEYRNEEPIEITELAFEIRPAPTAATGPPLTARLETPSPAPHSTPIPAEPAPLDLTEAEIRVWEALHATGADIKDSPEVWSDGAHILFRLFPDTPEEKQRVLEKLLAIPGVMESPSAPAMSASSATIREMTAPYTTTPPLADALSSSLGGSDSANRYLDSVRENYVQVLAETQALRRLAARYDAASLDKLPQDLRKRVEAIAADSLARLQPLSGSFVNSITPVLTNMSRLNNVPVGAIPVIPTGPCVPWQVMAQRTAAAAKMLEDEFLGLFVQQQTDQPPAADKVAMLRNAAAADAALRASTTSACPLP